MVTRFLTNSVPDNSFGDAPYAGSAFVQLPCAREPYGSYVAVDAIGRIILASSVTSKTDGSSYAVVARFTENGKIDNTFGVNGQVILRASDPDGFLVATNIAVNEGQTYVSAVHFPLHGGADGSSIFKLSEDGSLNGSFGNHGEFRYEPGSGGWVTCMALDASGHIFFADSSDTEMRVSKLTPEGLYDVQFGTARFHVGAAATSPRAMALDPNGGFKVFGFANDYAYDTGRIFLLHANGDGTLNAAMGSRGIYEEPCGFSNCDPRAMVVDKQGRPTMSVFSGETVVFRYDELFGDGFD